MHRSTCTLLTSPPHILNAKVRNLNSTDFVDRCPQSKKRSEGLSAISCVIPYSPTATFLVDLDY